MDILPIIISIVAVAISLYTVFYQAKISKQQQFESTFFNLLASIRELVNNTQGEVCKFTKLESDYNTYTSGTKRDGPYKGLEYYTKANLALQRRIWKALAEAQLSGELGRNASEKERLNIYRKYSFQAYNDFFDDHVSELAHYFRFIYNIVSLVNDTNDLSIEVKKKYINFIQAQMSADELSLLFYNGIGKYGSKFYDLMEMYNLLENIDRERTQNLIDVFYQFYPKTDFRFIRIEKAEELLLTQIEINKSKK